MPAQKQLAEIDGRRITISNLDKVLWPDAGVTKGDLIHYLLVMSPYLLPHLEGRPLVLTRYPDGATGESFYQKNTPEHAPDWLQTWEDVTHPTESGRILRYVVCNDRATLAWLGNQAALELHPWYSRSEAPDQPTVAVIDLDPAEGTDFEDARRVAFWMRGLLDAVGLRSYPKTSGATGLHLYIPLGPGHTYPQVVEFTRRLCTFAVSLWPQLTTVERPVANRTGRVYLDFLQNGRGKTLASVYSPRPVPGATVSCPLTWDEVATARPEQFTVRTMPQRVAQRGDLFAPVLHGSQCLRDAEPLLERLEQIGAAH